jgi:Ca-activated chloride channel family protein
MNGRSIPAALLTAMLTVSTAAQQPAFHAETRLVVLRATVRNGRGIDVTDLDRGAFTVYENGRRQPITLFRRDDVPVSIGLLIDNSGSMRSLRARAEVAALDFVRASNPLDEMFVVNFADTPRVDVPLTGDIRRLEAGIARVDSIGGTALCDAVELAEAYLRDHASHDRRVLLVITDGRDNASRVTLRDIEQLSRSSDTAVYAVGLFGAADSPEAKSGRHELDAMTARTGGGAYYPENVDRIDAIVADVAHQIRN